jgi:hypothetical protein
MIRIFGLTNNVTRTRNRSSRETPNTREEQTEVTIIFVDVMNWCVLKPEIYHALKY